LAFFADVWVFGGKIELLCVVSSKRKGTKTVDILFERGYYSRYTQPKSTQEQAQSLAGVGNLRYTKNRLVCKRRKTVLKVRIKMAGQ
jgi:hypothetical protein